MPHGGDRCATQSHQPANSVRCLSDCRGGKLRRPLWAGLELLRGMPLDPHAHVRRWRTVRKDLLVRPDHSRCCAPSAAGRLWCHRRLICVEVRQRLVARRGGRVERRQREARRYPAIAPELMKRGDQKHWLVLAAPDGRQRRRGRTAAGSPARRGHMYHRTGCAGA